MPRICILTETYHPVIGGGERQARMLAADLRASGLDVIIVTRRSDSVLPPADTLDDVPVYRISPVGIGRARRWLMVFSSLRALAQLRHRYDIIFVSGFKALGIPAVAIGKLFGKPVVLKADSNGEMSGVFFASGLRRMGLTPRSTAFRCFLAVRNAILRQADHFVAITAGIAEELSAHGVHADRIHPVSNGVDTERFRPAPDASRSALRRRLGLPEDRIVITYTGRLVTYKGLPLLLNVANRLRQDEVNALVVLIGAGGLDIHNCEAELREYVRVHHLETSVHFAGEVANVHEFLQASDMFVLPTADDAFPLSLVEAMACGLPVVSTRTGGIGDIVTDGQTGLLVRASDCQGLYEALRRLIADRTVSRSLGESAARAVKARYSRTIVADKYVALFQVAVS